MKKRVLIVLIIFLGFQISFIHGSCQFGLAAKAFEVKSVEQRNGKLYIYYNGSLTYNSFYLDKPYRFVVDFIGVKKCDKYEENVKTFNMGDGVVAKVFFHANDNLSKSYKEAVLRCAIVFRGYDRKPDCAVKPHKGLVEISCKRRNQKAFTENNTTEENIIERISYRRFPDYEMIVVLLKTKPIFKIRREGEVIYLTFNDTKAAKSALIGQNLSDEADNIDSIIALKTSNYSVKYVIKMKENSRFKRYYSDKRHVYLIFPVKKIISYANTRKFINQAFPIKKAENSTQQAGVFLDNRKVSFNVRDAQLKDIFRVFAKITGLNIVIGDDVKGTITMSLKDVPINQAMNLILQQNGLVAERKGNIVVIMTAARYQQEKMAQLKALQEKERYERLKSAITKTIILNYITPDYALGIINKLLYNGGNPKGGGFIVADTKNNALICHDTADNIAKIEKIVQMIDKKKLAVEIDARIVEISKTFERQLGIQWGGNYYNAQLGNSHTFIGVGGTTAPVSIGGSLPPSPNFTQDNFIVNLPATLSDAPTNTVSLAIGNVRAGYNLDLKLTMGEIEGYSKIISSPKVITLNNEMAKIESGQQIPYQQTAGASGATSVSFKSATLSLEVTPHITRNNQIILKITVKKDSPDFTHVVNGEPPINTNQVQTTVILKNGQTIVLGGLVQQTNIKTVKGIPLLMRIPFLGWLFKTKRIYNPQKELYIFVTPHILTK